MYADIGDVEGEKGGPLVQRFGSALPAGVSSRASSYATIVMQEGTAEPV